MLSYSNLRKGTRFVYNKEPYEVLDFSQVKKARGSGVAQTKIKNLITGSVLEKTFHQNDSFEEAELKKIELKFLYSHKHKFCFSKKDNPSQRFELTEINGKFLKPNEMVTGLLFQDKIINIILPVKVFLKVIESPPGIKGDRSHAGNKIVKVETGAEISVPLFIKEQDIIEINTEKEEYTRRIN